jgi:hypothetical protein
MDKVHRFNSIQPPPFSHEDPMAKRLDLESLAVDSFEPVVSERVPDFAAVQPLHLLHVRRSALLLKRG